MSVYSSSQLQSDNKNEHFTPSRSTSHYIKSPAIEDFPVSPPQATTTARKENFALSFYHSLSWVLGFKEKYSLLLFFIFGGGLLGFCLARSMMLNPKLIEEQTVPGEFFWFGRKMYKVNYYIHLYLTIIGGMLVGIQFLPGLRRRAVTLHRINGYIVLVCLLPGNITGSIIAVKSFGGEINAQSAYYILGIMIVFSGLVGIYNVKKQTRAHRKWMLRMVSYFATVITARVIMLIARSVISRVGTYYSVWRCDEMLYLFTDTAAAQELYPQCFGPGVNVSKVSVAVHASLDGTVLNVASAVRVTMGMALWVATIIHIIGVEIYIRKTESLNHNRYGYALEPLDYDGNGEPLWDYNQEK